MGRGGGQVVSVLAFYSDDPSSNPAEVYNFSVKIVIEKNKNKQKRGWGWPIFLHYQLRSPCYPKFYFFLYLYKIVLNYPLITRTTKQQNKITIFLQ